MIVLGITGGIGSGKSFAAEFFRSRGAAVIDADDLARDVVAPGSPVLAKLAAAFGDDVVRADGQLDRRKLAARVFGRPEAVATLNALTHPAILREMDRRVAQMRSAGAVRVACVVAPLLVEAGYHRSVDRVLVMVAEEETRVQRVMARDGVSREEVTGRIAAQMRPHEQRRYADWVVDASGSEESTRRQLEAIWGELGQ